MQTDTFDTIAPDQLVRANGGLLTVFASPSSPYTFAPGDAKGAFPELSGKTFFSTTVARNIGYSLDDTDAEDPSTADLLHV